MSVVTQGIVSRNPEVMHGEFVFAGTRVPVKSLVDHLKAGDALEDFLEGFPSVSREQAVAYLEMSVKATDELREREVKPESLDARAAR